MPCMKCANGKYKYGERGNCVYDTLAKCNAAAAAIHIQDKDVDDGEYIEDMYAENTLNNNIARNKN